MTRSRYCRLPAAVMTAGCSLLAVLTLLPACKTRPRGGVYIMRHKKPESPPAPAATPTAAAAAPSLGDPVYEQFVRPFFHKQGCDSTACHGAYRGGGMYLREPLGRNPKDYQSVLARLDRKNPEKSELVQKMLNQVGHEGGRNVDPKSCQYARLLAWIGQKADQPCTEPPPPELKPRFVREVAPALTALGCAAASCHGSGPARARFDLEGLNAVPAVTERAFFDVARYNTGNFATWRMALIRAADAADGVHKQKADPQSCAYRRLYSFLAKAPEQTCAVDAKPPTPLPSQEVFSTQVLPVLERRGCLQTACHGSGAGDMTLLPAESGPTAARHSYLVLLARVEDLGHIDDSTLLRTARNKEPHGGGQRLAGKGDCADDQLVAWLRSRPIRPCPPPQPPTYESFVSQMQPVLDRMTCTIAKCHGGAIPRFTLIRFATEPQQLQANYREVLGHIDYDYTPFSSIMLRMREPCAYAITAAWIERKPRPTCVLHDPDPSVFPQPDAEGNPVHPKTPPGPPPGVKL